MRLSELIKKLQQTLETEGDLPTFEGTGDNLDSPTPTCVVTIEDQYQLTSFTPEAEAKFSLKLGSKYLWL